MGKLILTPDKLYLDQGKFKELSANFPINTWEVADEDIAQVDSGVVTAQSKFGNTVVTATDVDGKTAEADILVNGFKNADFSQYEEYEDVTGSICENPLEWNTNATEGGTTHLKINNQTLTCSNAISNDDNITIYQDIEVENGGKYKIIFDGIDKNETNIPSYFTIKVDSNIIYQRTGQFMSGYNISSIDNYLSQYDTIENTNYQIGDYFSDWVDGCAFSNNQFFAFKQTMIDHSQIIAIINVFNSGFEIDFISEKTGTSRISITCPIIHNTRQTGISYTHPQIYKIS